MKKYYLPVSGVDKISIEKSLKDIGFSTSKRDVLSLVVDEMYDAKYEGEDNLVHGYIVMTVKKVVPVATTKPSGEQGKIKYLSKKRKKFRHKHV
jgi:hypothetical protein